MSQESNHGYPASWLRMLAEVGHGDDAWIAVDPTQSVERWLKMSQDMSQHLLPLVI
jgi:hypothetical protein